MGDTNDVALQSFSYASIPSNQTDIVGGGGDGANVIADSAAAPATSATATATVQRAVMAQAITLSMPSGNDRLVAVEDTESPVASTALLPASNGDDSGKGIGTIVVSTDHEDAVKATYVARAVYAVGCWLWELACVYRARGKGETGRVLEREKSGVFSA